MARFSKHVRFEPWVGANYENRPNRLLLVGESHYGSKSDDDRRGITIEWVSNFVDGENNRFFSKVTNLCRSLTGDAATRSDIWQQFAFYNYLQSMLHEPRQEPPSHLWQEGEIPFYEVLDVLAPTHIFVLGWRNWENIPKRREETFGEELNRLGNTPYLYGTYEHASGMAYAAACPHPSTKEFTQAEKGWATNLSMLLEL